MKMILKLIIIFLLAFLVVGLSPFVVKYPHVKPLVIGGTADDTITHVYSGFPIPYMHRTNLSMNMDINKIIFAIDVVFVAIAFGWILNKFGIILLIGILGLITLIIGWKLVNIR